MPPPIWPAPRTPSVDTPWDMRVLLLGEGRLAGIGMGRACVVGLFYAWGMSERLAKLQKLLALDERDVFVLYGLAQEYGKVGEYAQAVGFYDRALAVDPGYCYAYYH
ncbi:MAG: tetratricopeptide repeat protein, partial [bacterium]